MLSSVTISPGECSCSHYLYSNSVIWLARLKFLLHVIRRRSTFLSLPSWLADARALASPDLVCILVGTKLDREAEEREVSWMEASQFAKENGNLSFSFS